MNDWSEKKKIGWTTFFCMILILIMIAVTGCSKNYQVHTFGGKMTIDLPAGQKLENVTWKKDGENGSPHLWILKRTFRAGEVPETHYFTEKSAFGNWQGEVTIIEHPLAVEGKKR